MYHTLARPERHREESSAHDEAARGEALALATKNKAKKNYRKNVQTVDMDGNVWTVMTAKTKDGKVEQKVQIDIAKVSNEGQFSVLSDC